MESILTQENNFGKYTSQQQPQPKNFKRDFESVYKIGYTDNAKNDENPSPKKHFENIIKFFETYEPNGFGFKNLIDKYFPEQKNNQSVLVPSGNTIKKAVEIAYNNVEAENVSYSPFPSNVCCSLNDENKVSYDYNKSSFDNSIDFLCSQKYLVLAPKKQNAKLPDKIITKFKITPFLKIKQVKDESIFYNHLRFIEATNKNNIKISKYYYSNKENNTNSNDIHTTDIINAPLSTKYFDYAYQDLIELDFDNISFNDEIDISDFEILILSKIDDYKIKQNISNAFKVLKTIIIKKNEPFLFYLDKFHWFTNKYLNRNVLPLQIALLFSPIIYKILSISIYEAKEYIKNHYFNNNHDIEYIIKTDENINNFLNVFLNKNELKEFTQKLFNELEKTQIQNSEINRLFAENNVNDDIYTENNQNKPTKHTKSTELPTELPNELLTKLLTKLTEFEPKKSRYPKFKNTPEIYNISLDDDNQKQSRINLKDKFETFMIFHKCNTFITLKQKIYDCNDEGYSKFDNALKILSKKLENISGGFLIVSSGGTEQKNLHAHIALNKNNPILDNNLQQLWFEAITENDPDACIEKNDLSVFVGNLDDLDDDNNTDNQNPYLTYLKISNYFLANASERLYKYSQRKYIFCQEKKFDEYSTLNIKKNNFLRAAGFKAAFIEAMAEISYFNIKDNIKIILQDIYQQNKENYCIESVDVKLVTDNKPRKDKNDKYNYELVFIVEYKIKYKHPPP